jgi:hypothetical protein
MKIFLIAVLVFSWGMSLCADGRTIYIVPFGPTFAGNALFNPQERDGTLLPFCALREAAGKLGYEIKAVYDITNLTDVAAIIFLNTHGEPRFMRALQRYNCPRILYLWEPPLHDALGYHASYHQQFTHVYSLSSDQVDNQRVFKWFYPQPVLTMIADVPSYAQKKLCTMVMSVHASNHPQELYTERLRALEFFNRLGSQLFEFYGGGWSSKQYACYRGIVPAKVDCLKNYRFSICYENTRDLPGYLTEKIFDCMIAGCVPVYWGDPEVTRYIPSNCFIDRRKFRTLDELYMYLVTMSAQVYEEYLVNIQDFLSSTRAYKFSIQAFVDTFLGSVIPQYDRTKIFNTEEIRLLVTSQQV